MVKYFATKSNTENCEAHSGALHFRRLVSLRSIAHLYEVRLTDCE